MFSMTRDDVTALLKKLRRDQLFLVCEHQRLGWAIENSLDPTPFTTALRRQNESEQPHIAKAIGVLRNALRELDESEKTNGV